MKNVVAIPSAEAEKGLLMGAGLSPPGFSF